MCCTWEGNDTRIQYSVFVCGLPEREKIAMRGGITALMKTSENRELTQSAKSSRRLAAGSIAAFLASADFWALPFDLGLSVRTNRAHGTAEAAVTITRCVPEPISVIARGRPVV
jgi:hypothetical protein